MYNEIKYNKEKDVYELPYGVLNELLKSDLVINNLEWTNELEDQNEDAVEEAYLIIDDITYFK